jgi:hypothetical protein
VATQPGNVIDQDQIDSLRRELHGSVFSEAANQFTSTASDAVSYVTEPVREVFYQSETKAFAIGSIFGATLVIISKLIP